MHSAEEDAFSPAISCTFLCIPFHLFPMVFLSLHTTLSYSSFTCLYFFLLMPLLNILFPLPLFGIFCCLFFISSRILSVILILFFFLFLKVTSFVGVTRASFKVFHFQLPISSKYIYLQIKSSWSLRHYFKFL